MKDDKIDRIKKEQEIEDFLSRFDHLAEDLETGNSSKSIGTPNASHPQNADSDFSTIQISQPSEPAPSPVTASRMQRHQGGKSPGQTNSNVFETSSAASLNDPSEAGGGDPPVTETQKRGDDSMAGRNHGKRKKHKLNKKTVLRNILIVLAALAVILAAWIVITIVRAPEINADNLYSLLAQNSTIYDADGEFVENLYSDSTGLRTNLDYSEMPEDLVNAFIAIEDKTFWTHSGFNVVRIFGAIWDSITSGDDIKGTSTITQQLARNLYLADIKNQRSLSRKITEAWVAIRLEQQLTKEQIIEAYLNTIYLGTNSNGVAAAAETYFSKSVDELELAECAVLATIPKEPTKYSPLITYNTDEVTDPDSLDIVKKDSRYTICYQENFKDRQILVLDNMLDQEMISVAESTQAKEYNIRDAINPGQNAVANVSSYFADYLVKQVVTDLMAELDIDEEAAKDMVYRGGLQIYSTLDLNAQKIVDSAFGQASNFPGVTGLNKDGNGNVRDSKGGILYYARDNLYSDDGSFLLKHDEYDMNSDGSMTISKGGRLNFYRTEVGGNEEISAELKASYYYEDNQFFSVGGAYLLIPSEYKTRDSEGNLVLSAEFFQKEDIFRKQSDGVYLIPGEYVQQQQATMQPQSSMVVMDYHNGAIIAMTGGRGASGKQLYNRATSTRQPGSSIKPISVYGPALQASANAVNDKKVKGTTNGGIIWNAATVVADTPLIKSKSWPKNWYNSYREPYRLRVAVQQSVNTVAARISSTIGPETSVHFLKLNGITSIVEDGDVNDMNSAALGLGGMTKGISALQMAAAYGTFPNEGIYTEPTAYTKVTNRDGDVILKNKKKTQEVFDKGVAYIMTDILRTTVSNGIASAAGFSGQPVAGKTGTTTDNYDAWFVGFTPYYSAALWIGNDMNVELTTGSTAAAKLWSKVMRQIHSGMETGKYSDAPDTVVSRTVDAQTGMLPNEFTTATVGEYFIAGTEPSKSAGGRTSSSICSDTGYLATPFCTNVEQQSFAGEVIGGTGSAAPKYYCNEHNNDPDKYPVDPEVTWNSDFIPPEKDDPEETPSDEEGDGTEEGESGTLPSEGFPGAPSAP